MDGRDGPAHRAPGQFIRLYFGTGRAVKGSFEEYSKAYVFRWKRSGLSVGSGRAGSSRAVLAVMMLALFVSVTNQTMVNVAIPAIRGDFGASEAAVGWVNTGYLLIFAVCVPVYGRLSDLYDTRIILLLGLLGFAVGTLVCILAPTLWMLIVGRAVQAAGAGAIPALAFGLVARTIPAGSRGTSLGLLSATIGAGAAFGPVIGGFIIGAGSWHTLFVLSLALIAVAACGVYLVVPKVESQAGAKRSLDLTSGALLGVSVALALFAVTEAGNNGIFSVIVLGSVVVCIVAMFLFLNRITHVEEPFVSPDLLSNREFIAACATGFFSQYANVAGLFIIPLFLIEELRLPAIVVGFVLLPGAVVVALLSPLAGRLSDRVGLRPVLFAGLSTFLCGLLFMSSFGVGESIGYAIVGMTLLGFGFAATNATASNAASDSLTPDSAGVGLGIYQMCFFLGAGFAPAILGAFLTFRQTMPVGATNPLYAFDTPAFSDAFLVAASGTVISLVAACFVTSGKSGGKVGASG